MDNNFWESEELSMEEVSDQFLSPAKKHANNNSHGRGSNFDQLLDSEDYESEDDLELLTNARLRLEQGKLYEMLLNHDLFGSVDADPRAIKNVQKEIRNFIKDRLEILLGLKQDPRLHRPEVSAGAALPFTALEIDLLKRFLAKMSKGATEAVTAPVEPRPALTAPKQESIRPLSAGPTQKLSPAKTVPVQRPPEPASQIKNTNSDVKRILEEEFGENEMPLEKPASSMTMSELMERNRRIAQRQSARKAKGNRSAPPLSPDQEAMIMMQHVMNRNESLNQEGVTPLNLAITKALQNKAE